MLSRPSFVGAGGLLAGWLSLGMVSLPAGPSSFVLEAPAAYVSVGQEFNPRIVNYGAGGEFAAEVRSASGAVLWQQEATVAPGDSELLEAVTLPRAGGYRLRARQEDAAPGGWQEVELTAVPEPASDLGGVSAVAAAGLDAGVADYLGGHGFAVSALQVGQTPRVIVMGDARLGETPAERTAAYSLLWSEVASGAHLLVLGPPPPGMDDYWPETMPLIPASAGACGGAAFPPEAPELEAGVDAGGTAALLTPALRFDLDANRLTPYHLDGTQMFKWNAASCAAFLTFRVGDGWVTVTTLPVLGHFEDTRARRYLMNLVATVERRGRSAPPAPGLARVLQQSLGHLPPQPPFAAAAAGFYQPPPAAVAPALVWAPSITAPNPRACFSQPTQRAGAAVILNLRPAVAATALQLAFGTDARRWPQDAAVEGSPDGVHWRDLGPMATPTQQGSVTVPLPAGGPAHGWADLRLRLTRDDTTHGWSVCGMWLGQ